MLEGTHIRGGETARGRVTINDLADALGLTKGTVSRALNDYPDISPTTRQRVKRQAERMGYKPLAQAQAIRTGRSRAIGLVLQTDVEGAQRPFLANFLEGVTREASAAGWTLTVATSVGEDEMLRTLSRLVEERKADGFILPRTYANDARMEFLRDAGVPFVLYGRVVDERDCAWFDILGENAIRSATLRLVEHGHSRIGFVNGGLEYNFSRLRRDGYREGLAEAGIDFDDALVVDGAMTRAQGEAATLALLSRPVPPTAIVYAVDLAALGAYDVAERTGFRIGQDLSVISYDGIPEGRWVSPRLSTFSVDSRFAGAKLAELLIRRVRGADPETLRETAEAELQAGGSDGPPRMTTEEIAQRMAEKAA